MHIWIQAMQKSTILISKKENRDAVSYLSNNIHTLVSMDSMRWCFFSLFCSFAVWFISNLKCDCFAFLLTHYHWLHYHHHHHHLSSSHRATVLHCNRPIGCYFNRVMNQIQSCTTIKDTVFVSIENKIQSGNDDDERYVHDRQMIFKINEVDFVQVLCPSHPFMKRK